MLSPNQLFPYQKKAILFQSTHPCSALWLDPGLGKTSVTLNSVEYLIRVGFLRSVLIVAPIRVCRLVWRQEALKWSNLSHMTFSMMLGTKDQRGRALNNTDGRHVFLVNYENLKWLGEALQTHFISKGKPLPFDGIVFDEISKCKNSTTKRVHALAKVMSHFKWRTGLTGTPASNGYKDLHGQYLVLDDGKRLGTAKTAFMHRYYHKEGFKDVSFKSTEDEIKYLISDMTLEMSAADYNPLPDLIVNNVEVELPDELRVQYDQMEREMFLKLDSGQEIDVFNQASLMNKALQFANGAIYPVPGVFLYEELHDLKLDALEEIIDECNGNQVLCSYAFKSDAERIMTRFKHLRPINLTECHTEKALSNAMYRWSTGDCALMIGHFLSMSHGIDGLQKMGHTLVWFGLTWSLEGYDQFNARLRRQNQGAPVICHRIVCKDTVDQAQMLALENKAETQTSLRKAVKEYREKKYKIT